VPDGTWIVVSDWFAHPLRGRRFDIPLNPRLRPIFVSFYTDVAALAAPGAIEYLRRYEPIGCLDLDTVFLLQAAGISAFFSGAISSTVDLVVPPTAGSAAPGHTVYVDTAPDGPGETATLHTVAVRRRRLPGNLEAVVDSLRGYQQGRARVVTSDLRWYLASRAVGASAEFRPKIRGDIRTADLGGIAHLKGIADLKDQSDDVFAEMQRNISDKLAAVLGAVLEGRPEEEVYRVWREVCAADVAHAESLRGKAAGTPTLSFDVNDVCRVIRQASVTIERRTPGPDGPEINVEFSLDARYKHQLDIVLDSIVSRASRPVRAFVLCRQHGPADFERMARLFPTVSFVWLPSDNVDYGTISGMNAWVTPATMDRTVLPVLLPEIDRIIHFDLDALCLTDLAELYDVDLAGRALAAAPEPQPSYVSGFETLRRSASRLRREGKPELARELIVRTHAQHAFDFDVFNAGIMVLDLAKMRADDFCGRFLPYVQRFGVNGQVVINLYLGREYTRLGGEWNRLMRLEVPGEVKIAHWAGPHKPWEGHQYVTGRELWREQEAAFANRVARLDEAVSTTSG
jgi:lipopolysaccharide biosynthesis glycosyltransferase